MKSFDDIEAFDQLVRVVEGNIFVVSFLHLAKAFDLVTFAEDSQKVLFCELFSLFPGNCWFARVGGHCAVLLKRDRLTMLVRPGL